MTEANFLDILVVEDNEGDAILIQEYVKEEFPLAQMTQAWNLAQTEQYLQKNNYSLIF